MYILTRNSSIGYVILHELFHLDSLSKLGSQGHIKDMKLWYKSKRARQTVPHWNSCHGASKAKVLALFETKDLGNYVIRNGKAPCSLAETTRDSSAYLGTYFL